MTAGRRYAFGLTFVALGGALAGVLLPAPIAAGWWPALVLALAVQAPLGWWLVRARGGPRFLGAWAAGLLARFGLVGIAALLLVPALGWPPAATLVSLVGLLVALLAVEGAAVLVEQSHAET